MVVDSSYPGACAVADAVHRIAVLALTPNSGSGRTVDPGYSGVLVRLALAMDDVIVLTRAPNAGARLRGTLHAHATTRGAINADGTSEWRKNRGRGPR
jgi:hypothetical protein